MKKNNLGGLIVDGPRALFLPHGVIRNDWLNPCLHIYRSADDVSFLESVTVFTDGNRAGTRGFLQPLIRHARWLRGKDLELHSEMPNVSVCFGPVRNWRSVQTVGRRVQAALLHPPFTVYGHSKNGACPYLEVIPNSMTYTVKTGNGWQHLEYDSPELVNDPVTPVLRDAMDKLICQITPMDMTGWRERYEYNLPALAPQEPWEWTVGNGFVDSWEPVDKQVRPS